MDQSTQEIIQCLGVLQDGLVGIREENKCASKESERIRIELQDIRKEHKEMTSRHPC